MPYSTIKAKIACHETVWQSVSWLKQALIYAHHNMKTNPPDSRPNKRYWTKANLIAYLHSCSCSGKLIEAIYQSARRKEKHPPFPATWADCDAFSKCHYAPMHMVYLGHVKSDIEMLLKWLNRNEVLATFGKQANIYLSAV